MKKRVTLFALTCALLATAFVAGNVMPAPSRAVVLADGGPILVCPPGKTHDACNKNNPLPPGGGL